MLETFFSAFQGPGAAFTYAILAIFAYGLTIFVERLLQYEKKWKIDKTQLNQLLSAQKWSEAQAHLGEHPAGLLLEAKNKQGLFSWDSLAMAAPLIENKTRQRISSLNLVANISTMLGLLGTVYGLIFALEGLEQASSIERTSRLSEGIGAAMLTTAWGLLVGIPAMFAHNILSNKAEQILAFCESTAARILVFQNHSSKEQE